MSGLGVLLVVLAVLVANVPRVMAQWRADRSGLVKTLELMIVYLVYCGLGVALLIWIVPTTGSGEVADDKALELMGLMLGWIMYGALTLMRAVPHYREPPQWVTRFGIADVLVLGLLLGCLAAYFWM